MKKNFGLPKLGSWREHCGGRRTTANCQTLAVEHQPGGADAVASHQALSGVGGVGGGVPRAAGPARGGLPHSGGVGGKQHVGAGDLRDGGDAEVRWLGRRLRDWRQGAGFCWAQKISRITPKCPPLLKNPLNAPLVKCKIFKWQWGGDIFQFFLHRKMQQNAILFAFFSFCFLATLFAPAFGFLAKFADFGLLRFFVLKFLALLGNGFY